MSKQEISLQGRVAEAEEAYIRTTRFFGRNIVARMANSLPSDASAAAAAASSSADHQVANADLVQAWANLCEQYLHVVMAEVRLRKDSGCAQRSLANIQKLLSDRLARFVDEQAHKLNPKPPRNNARRGRSNATPKYYNVAVKVERSVDGNIHVYSSLRYYQQHTNKSYVIHRGTGAEFVCSADGMQVLSKNLCPTYFKCAQEMSDIEAAISSAAKANNGKQANERTAQDYQDVKRVVAAIGRMPVQIKADGTHMRMYYFADIGEFLITNEQGSVLSRTRLAGDKASAIENVVSDWSSCHTRRLRGGIAGMRAVVHTMLASGQDSHMECELMMKKHPGHVGRTGVVLHSPEAYAQVMTACRVHGEFAGDLAYLTRYMTSPDELAEPLSADQAAIINELLKSELYNEETSVANLIREITGVLVLLRSGLKRPIQIELMQDLVSGFGYPAERARLWLSCIGKGKHTKPGLIGALEDIKECLCLRYSYGECPEGFMIGSIKVKSGAWQEVAHRVGGLLTTAFPRPAARVGKSKKKNKGDKSINKYFSGMPAVMQLMQRLFPRYEQANTNVTRMLASLPCFPAGFDWGSLVVAEQGLPQVTAGALRQDIRAEFAEKYPNLLHDLSQASLLYDYDGTLDAERIAAVKAVAAEGVRVVIFTGRDAESIISREGWNTGLPENIKIVSLYDFCARYRESSYYDQRTALCKAALMVEGQTLFDDSSYVSRAADIMGLPKGSVVAAALHSYTFSEFVIDTARLLLESVELMILPEDKARLIRAVLAVLHEGTRKFLDIDGAKPRENAGVTAFIREFHHTSQVHIHGSVASGKTSAIGYAIAQLRGESDALEFYHIAQDLANITLQSTYGYNRDLCSDLSKVCRKVVSFLKANPIPGVCAVFDGGKRYGDMLPQQQHEVVSRPRFTIEEAIAIISVHRRPVAGLRSLPVVFPNGEVQTIESLIRDNLGAEVVEHIKKDSLIWAGLSGVGADKHCLTHFRANNALRLLLYVALCHKFDIPMELKLSAPQLITKDGYEFCSLRTAKLALNPQDELQTQVVRQLGGDIFGHQTIDPRGLTNGAGAIHQLDLAQLRARATERPQEVSLLVQFGRPNNTRIALPTNCNQRPCASVAAAAAVATVGMFSATSSSATQNTPASARTRANSI